MEILSTFIHYFLHFGAPVIIARVFFRKDRKMVTLLLRATMLVDVDHLLATPIFDPGRCSIGFHPLHSWYAIAVYVVMLFFPGKVRIIAIGLLFHMMTDGLDCVI